MIKKNIKEYLKVDSSSKTGLRWIKRPSMRVNAGDEAFTGINGEGYYNGGFDRGVYYAHQVIMFLEHNKWSDSFTNVHHKDENKLNNNLSNLEFISRSDHNKIHFNKK